MGGVHINEHAELVKESGSAIPGLFAAGEVAGGVHGQNRLGGSGLLGAVVYGRVAGASATKFLLNQLSSQSAQRRTAAITQQLFSSFSLKHTKEGIQITLGYPTDTEEVDRPAQQTTAAKKQQPPASSSSSASAAKPSSSAPSASSPPPSKEIDMSEVERHNTDSDCWVVVNGQVLNATPFLDKHPGGRQAILLYAGRDATEEFNMLHKPDVVQKYAPEIILGNIKKGTTTKKTDKQK